MTPSLLLPLSIYLFTLDMATLSFFLVELLGMPCFSFWCNHDIYIYFRDILLERDCQLKEHLFGGWMDHANFQCRNFASESRTVRDLDQESMKRISLGSQ